MKDIERKVTEFLKDDAADAHRPAQMPDGMTKRIRRHQTRTALVTGVAVMVIIAVSVVGFRTLLPLASDKATPAAPGINATSGPRIASLTSAQIEVPEGWWLTDLSNVPALPGGAPRQSLVLTNYPPDLSAKQGPMACGDGGYESASNLPEGGAALVVGSGNGPEFVLLGGSVPKQPQLEPSPISCARQLTATWSPTGNVSDDLRWAVATIGPNGPDPSVMQAALDSLKYPGEYPAPPEPASDTRLPQLWIGQGNDPQPWNLTAYQAGDSPKGGVFLAFSLDSNGTAGSVRVGLEVPGFGAIGEADGGTLYGTVAAEATEIAVELPDGSLVQGQLFPVPSSLWGPAQAFVQPVGDAVVSGFLVARDATGAVLGSLPLSNGGAAGDSRYGPWSLTSTLKDTNGIPASAFPLQLHIDGGTHDVGDPLKDPGATMIDPQALVLGQITGAAKDGRYEVGTLVFGSLGSDVASVEFRSDDDSLATQSQILSIYGAEGGWRGFGLVTEAQSGVVTARDAAGKVLEQYALGPFVNANDPAAFALVVAEGSQGDTSWRMFVDPSDPSCVGLDSFTSDSGSFGGGCGGSLPTSQGMSYYQTADLPGVKLVYGAVTPGSSVDVSLSLDTSPIPATVVTCPCGPINKTDYFYAQLPVGAKFFTPQVSPAQPATGG